jgi:alkanesulfonate monooxygenase SsuD/methylene tetrahydromethanopterin reductase-like flavin-dependent oxidoreductase (luciferase family)
MEETVAAMRALWAADGEPASFAGELVAFEDVAVRPAPARMGGPPIWMAGAGEAAERRVGRLADGWLPYPPDPGSYAAGVARIRAAAERHGRPMPVPALYATVAVERAGTPARTRLRDSVERYYDAPLEALAGIQAMFAGSASEIGGWLSEYARAGARHVVLRVADDDPRAALEVLGAEVLPAVVERAEVPV